MLYAIHRLGVSDPDVELVATGDWNPDGSPIMKKATKSILAGSLFPASLLEGGAAEVQRLIDLGAIRYPDAAELALFERNRGET
ncbi:hypothetical protein A0J57_14030 [Sphingobium sp. 22B]|nr:hypothetical protein AXW74_15130 [Sphingobium sp. AM]KYC31737.1 hypothetical protein A0J57_14030 [Sphingobium sp. 22B]OAP31059.1 hypothetical protein A8O16_15415 [Sphingobium sp. 20006FA]